MKVNPTQEVLDGQHRQLEGESQYTKVSGNKELNTCICRLEITELGA